MEGMGVRPVRGTQESQLRVCRGLEQEATPGRFVRHSRMPETGRIDPLLEGGLNSAKPQKTAPLPLNPMRRIVVTS
jgi:hypothetical protein